MLFNSFDFLIFFPLVTLIYYLLPHRYRWAHLLLASCIFYCAFIPIYIFILFFTITIDYVAGRLIEKSVDKKRKHFLILSVLANISVLIVFKYLNFLTENMNVLLSVLHITTHPLPFLNIILPIGLSFHTFQAMSYTIEVYRGNQKAEKHFGIYALYVMFYPQLVAGPIERPQNLLHQFYEKHELRYENLLHGLRQMLWGLFKKVVIADRLALFVNPVFQSPNDYNAINLLIAIFFFAYQVYFDFSGYSDIALGSAKLLGFNLTRNFNHPFQSKNVTEFWRRWHISLSSWLSDYIFNPIIINYRNGGKAAIVFGLLITFFISGLWHGAGWTFAIFGLLHGAAVTCEFLTQKFRKNLSKQTLSFLYNAGSQFLTFCFLLFSWIFFRANSLEQASLFVSKISSYSSLYFQYIPSQTFGKLSFAVAILGCIYVLILERYLDPELDMLNHKPILDFAFCTLALFLVLSFGVFEHLSFIYFQF